MEGKQHVVTVNVFSFVRDLSDLSRYTIKFSNVNKPFMEFKMIFKMEDRFMFSINLTYPSFEEEVQVVKLTTSSAQSDVEVVFSAQEILEFQALIRKIPVADNVIEYAVKMVGKTRPNSSEALPLIKQYVDWGAGPRASQNLILAAKTFSVIKGKFSPDIEDVQAVAISILRHRIIKNYKAEADGISVETIIESLF